MDKHNSYFDNVLIRLKRQYSKDEYVSALLKKFSEQEIEKGIITSERDEAIFALNEFLNLPSDVKSRIGQRKYYRQRIKEIKSLREKNKKLKIDNERLFHKLTLKNA